MRKKIIATGISGLVGSRIAELLKEEFYFINFSLDSGVDITDFKSLEKKFRQFLNAKSVIHLAAFTDVDAAFAQNGNKNGSVYKINVLGSKNIAQLCEKYNKYLIHISTDFVFDGRNPPKGGYTEEDKPHPIEWYGKTKYLAEKEVQKLKGNYTILRIAFPYKAKSAIKELEPNPKLDLVRKIMVKLQNREELKMFFDQIITPTFIDDIALVIKKCFEKKPLGIFHCVGSTSLSPYNLALKVASNFGFDKNLIKKTSLIQFLKNNPYSRPRQKNLILSNKKIEKILKIKMTNFERGLKKIKQQLKE